MRMLGRMIRKGFVVVTSGGKGFGPTCRGGVGGGFAAPISVVYSRFSRFILVSIF